MTQISGGTGIAPFMQLLHTLSPPFDSSPAEPPKLPLITLVHASSSLPLRILTQHFPEPYLLPTRLELVDLSPGRPTPQALADVLGSGPLSALKGEVRDVVHAPGQAAKGLWSHLSSLFSSSPPSDSQPFSLKPSSFAPPPTASSSSAVGPPRPTSYSPSETTLILVSGPDGMISSVAGPPTSLPASSATLRALGVREGDRVEVRRFWNDPRVLGQHATAGIGRNAVEANAGATAVVGRFARSRTCGASCFSLLPLSLFVCPLFDSCGSVCMLRVWLREVRSEKMERVRGTKEARKAMIELEREGELGHRPPRVERG